MLANNNRVCSHKCEVNERQKKRGFLLFIVSRCRKQRRSEKDEDQRYSANNASKAKAIAM